jgi:nitroimidazol reductase NimA-like FMN-containing flavoprotein (pyridoxamine 5'-phosphate oxidase superfamily)
LPRAALTLTFVRGLDDSIAMRAGRCLIVSDFEATTRTRLKRLPKRGSYEREEVYRILDEGLVCHVGFVAGGEPFVIPTGYARVGDDLYIHGSAASRMLRSLAGGVRVCVTVTLLDGLVLARSAFHHSMNYRSVVVFGTASVVESVEESREALRAFTERMIPGRWSEVRPPDESELRQTLVLKLPLSEASAKVRTGPPIDDEPDYQLPVWAGEIPLRLTAAAPVPDPRLTPEREPPSYALRYSRGAPKSLPTSALDVSSEVQPKLP